MDKAKIEDFCSAPAELFQVHSLHLISTGILCRTSGAFTAPHLLRNALPDFRCIHCTSSLPKCSAGLQVTSCHLISTGMLCRTSGAFTAPHLHRNAPPDFRCIHCTSSLLEYSAGLQVHSLHLISSGILCQTSGAFTAPHLYRETPSASGAMNAPEVKKCCYATKHYQCRMSYLYGFNYIL